MKRTKLLGALLAMLGCQGGVHALPLGNDIGLANQSPVIRFSEVALARGTVVKDQYVGFGVTFSGFFYDPQPGVFSSPSLGNFVLDDPNNPRPTVPVFIYFLENIAEIAFARQTSSQQIAFEAFLDDKSVEKNESTEPYLFFGFTDIVFNKIQISTSGEYLLIDDLQFSPAASVPEPGLLALLGLGFAGLLVSNSRRRAAAA